MYSFANTVVYYKYSFFSDVRSKREYDESHVITALRVKKVYWQSQNLGQVGYIIGGGHGRMGDFILDPDGGTYYWTLWAVEVGPLPTLASTMRVFHISHTL